MKKFFIDLNICSNHIKSDTRNEVENDLDVSPIKVGSETLTKGKITSLDGYFNVTPVEYVGYDKERRMIIFFLGEESDLFSRKQYYQTFYYINENRLAIATMESCMTDFKFINGKWK